MKLVSYDKCKDCEHYGVWSQRCWNVYGCPKGNDYECPNDTLDYIPYSVRKLHAIHDSSNKKEVKIDAENESLSEADRKEILDLSSFIKGAGIACGMQCICDAADKIRSIIEH